MRQRSAQIPDDALLAALRDERLARLATSARPAWLWSTDGLRILWANAVGTAIFGARSSTELARVTRSPADRSGRQVARLAAQLVPDKGMRLERLPDFGAPLGGLSTCACARISFSDHDAILIAGIDTPARAMPFEQRLARLIDGTQLPLAVFTGNGTLVAASPAAADLVDGARTLADFGGKLATMRLGENGDAAFAALVTEKAMPAVTEPVVPEPTAASPMPAADLPAAKPPQPERTLSSSARFDPDKDEAGAHDIAPIDPDSVIEQYLSEEEFIETAMATEEHLGHAADRFETMPDILSDDDIFEEAAAADWPEPNAPQKPASESPEEKPVAIASEPAPVSHRPLRFVWQTDADGRFSISTEDFTRLIGESYSAQPGRPWTELAQACGLDPQGAIARALEARQTWTGLRASWPADGTATRLETELSGIPLFGADGQFQGFRGFGICRDDAAIAELNALRASDIPEPARSQTQDIAQDVAQDIEQDIDFPKDDSMTITPSNERDEPPALMSPSANVVQLRPDMRPPVLTPVENNAFNEIARQLSARLEAKPANDAEPLPVANDEAAQAPVVPATADDATHHETPVAAAAPQSARASAAQERTLLERMPFGVLVYRLDRLLFANPAFLERTGYRSLHDLTEAGGLDALYVEPGVAETSSTSNSGTPLRVAATEADPSPSEARLMTVGWDGEDALALILLPSSIGQAAPAAAATDVSPPAPQAVAAGSDAAPVGNDARGKDSTTTESVPADFELAQARREATRAATAKADLLARISHDIRAPLSAITGFADVMIEQRFGPLGNERYVEYMKDIRASGERVVSIVDDMLDLTQIESGQVALAFAAHHLNPVVEQCVAALQPQANRERIIIRSSLARILPPVVADGGSLRQIATMLIASAIRVSRPGAQIIVSTALQDSGEVVLRLRDAGHVMSESEIGAIMDPLGSGPRDNSDGSSLDLSMARALITANRAKLQIRSTPQSGTLIEVAFSPPSLANSAASQR